MTSRISLLKKKQDDWFNEGEVEQGSRDEEKSQFLEILFVLTETLLSKMIQFYEHPKRSSTSHSNWNILNPNTRENSHQI